MKINYSLLLYLVCIPLGYNFYVSGDGNFTTSHILCFSVAILMTMYGGFLNGKHQMKYRSVLWIFFLNLLLISGYIISNGGTGNAPWFGGSDWPLGFLLLQYWLNMQWTYLSSIDLPFFSGDFSFLFILVCCSFLFPSMGFLIGKLWCKRLNRGMK